MGRVGADYIVNDKGVSRVHLTVHVKGKNIWLEDMKSANGTFVAGQKLPPGTHVPYKPGTKIQLGLAGDAYSFEVAELMLTQASAREEESALIRNPSRALSTPPPTIELAEQADKFLKEARDTASGIKEAAVRESEMLMNNARTKANEALVASRNEAVAMIEKARNSASQATLDRERAAENAMSSARREAIEIKNAADEEAEKTLKDARGSTAQLKLEGQREAEVIVQHARDHAEKVKDEADLEARDMLKTTRDKIRTMLEKNDAEIEQAMLAARKAAAGVRAEADAQLEKARAYVSEKGATLLKEAESQAEQILVQAEEQAANIRANAKADSQKAVDNALKAAQQKVARIQEEARESIVSLQSEVTRMQFEVSSMEKRKRDAIMDAESVTQSCDAAKARAMNESEQAKLALVTTQEMLTNLQAEGEKARVNLALANTMRENAERLAKDLREEREKGLLEFENQKKQQETELASTKLKLLEDIKARQLEEEARMHAIRGHQASEMTRHLEMVLVPIVQKQLGEKDATMAIAEFRQAIGPVVKRVVYEEQANLSTNDLENVISSDPIIEKYKRKQRTRAQAMVGVPMMMFFLAVFAPGVFEFMRQPATFLAGGKSLDELNAEYSERSRKKVYAPPLVEELGSNYTDSVLYTREYVSKKLDDGNRKRWAKELENFMFRQLDLPESIAINYIGVETRLVKELQMQRAAINPDFVKEGIAKMRELEKRTMPELKGKVGGDITYEKIRAFEKRFFESLVIKAPASVQE